MKKLFILILLVLIALVSVTSVVVVSPYYYYSKILQNSYESEWYNLPSFQFSYLTPDETVEGSSKELGNDDLWQKFHFMDVVLPIPVHNPFFYVSPVLSYNKDNRSTSFGLRLYSESNREISKLYFIRNRLFPNVIKSQKLFKLPLVKKELEKYTNDQVWKDIFTRKIEGWNIPFSQMAYNLYLIQLRSKILPDKFISYSLVKDTSTAIIELESKNKDYTTEMILTYSRGLIYSFILLTEKDNPESELVRYKFLNEVSFRGGSSRLTNILYLEFKGLEYRDQIDHKGMLYLLSAWTHSMEDEQIIREMIENLEKGQKNQKQLEVLYSYALERFNTTFTTRNIEDIDVSDEVLLKRNVELENKKEEQELANRKEIIKSKNKETITEEEKINNFLDDIKKNKKTNDNKIIID